MTRWRDTVTAVMAAAAIIALVAGVPAALVVWAGSPFDGPWAMWLEAARYGQLDAGLMVSVLTIVVWVAWLHLMVSLAVEAVAAARGVVARRRVPLVITQPLAARLVSAALLLSAVAMTRPPAALAAAPASAAATADITAPADADAATQRTEARSPQRRRYVVERRDTLWGIAERHLGNGRRWRQIRDLNVGRPQPGGASLRADSTMIDVGWTLLLPADATAPDASGDDDAVRLVTVDRGDTLWELADDHLGSARRWPALYRHNRGRIQPDGDRLRDPDVIRPGWQLDVDLDADRPRDAAAANDGQRRQPRAPDVPRDRPPPPTGRVDHNGTDAKRDDHDGDGTRTGVSPAAEATDPRAARQPGPQATPPPQPADARQPRVDTAAADDDAGGWVWWTTGGLLAAGVAATVARQQRIWRRRRRVGDATPAAASDLGDPPDPGGSDRYRQRAMLAVRAYAAGDQSATDVLGVALDRDGDVALLLERNAPNELPDGWQHDPDDTRVAVLPAAVADTDLERRAVVASPVAATLVTAGVGSGSGQLVLLALESCRSIAATGPDDAVEALLLGWAVELATSEFAAAVDVWLVGFDLDDHPATGWERLHPVDSVEQAIVGIRDVALGTQPPDRLPRRGDDDWVPQIIMCAPTVAATHVQAILSFAHDYADAGVVVVTAASAATQWSLAVTSDTVTITSLQQPVRLDRVEPLTRERFLALTGMVAAAKQTATATMAVATDTPESARQLLARVACDPGPLTDVDAVPSDLVLVRVLGPVTVEPPSGDTVPAGRTTEAVAYLACRRAEVPADRLIDVLWHGRVVDRQRLTEVLSRARAAIGGAQQLPRADSDRGYLVSDSVITDIELLAWHVSRAQRADDPAAVLHSGLELVRGRPFEDVEWSWALFDGITTAAAALVADAAAACSALLLERGDTAAALAAVHHGLRAAPESEALGRQLMRIHHARGEYGEVHAVMQRLRTNADDDLGPDGDDQLHPDTVRLYRELTAAAASTVGG